MGLTSSSRTLRTGDWVVVRSKEEILATLVPDGTVEGMPFMPEMLQFCGQRLRVAAVAHKTCDPAHKTGGRRLENAVHLEDARCHGSAHGGCEASCLLFWKTAWLAPADSPSPADPSKVSGGVTEEALKAATHAPSSTSEKPIYSCQATRLFDATRKLQWWDVRQYVRDLFYGNVTPDRMARILVLSWFRALMRTGIAFHASRAAYRLAHRLLLGSPPPEVAGGGIADGAPTPVANLGLQPGQRVKVRQHAEIRATLTRNNKNRGMWFDDEATVFCGAQFEVERRVQRIINEVSGEMMQMKTPCITLKGVYCRSMYSRDRLFCPRAITPYWREIWLEPVARPGERPPAG